MDRITIAGGAAMSASASYDSSITFSQEGPAGSVSFCNNGFGQGTGFWSVRGMSPVPVRLQVAHDPLDADTLDLRWSGASPTFELYRAVLPSNVLDPAHLTATTTDCATLDTPPTEPDFIYYLIKPVGN
jgi:hypothetical protein